MRTLVFAAVALLVGAGTVLAQVQDPPVTGPVPDKFGRNCQTVLTCNFARGAAVRGCLSSYTCRRCRLVRANCTIYPGQGSCTRLVCGWGS